MFLQIKDRKHIEQNFHSVAGVMPQGWEFRVLGVKNFRVGICDGAPSTARSSFFMQAYSDAWKKISFIMTKDNNQYVWFYFDNQDLHIYQIIVVSFRDDTFLGDGN